MRRIPVRFIRLQFVVAGIFLYLAMLSVARDSGVGLPFIYVVCTICALFAASELIQYNFAVDLT